MNTRLTKKQACGRAIAACCLIGLMWNNVAAEPRPPASGLPGIEQQERDAAPRNRDTDSGSGQSGDSGPALQNRDGGDGAERPSGCIFRDRPLELIV